MVTTKQLSLLEVLDDLGIEFWLSPTKMKAWETCNAHFKRMVIDGVSPPEYPFGKNLHKVYQDFYEIADLSMFLNATQVSTMIVEIIEGTQPSEFLTEEYMVHINNFATFEERRWHLTPNDKKDNFLPVATESWIINEDDKFRGIADRFDIIGNGLLINDYKTGYPRRKMAYNHQKQLLQYALGNIKNPVINGNVTHIGIIHTGGPAFNLRKLTKRLLTGAQNRRDRIWREICEAIERNEFPAKQSRACEYCHVLGWCVEKTEQVYYE